MAWTQAEYDALKVAIARGVQTVTYDTRTVTYQRLEDMLALLAVMAADLSADAGQHYAYRFAATSKGV